MAPWNRGGKEWPSVERWSLRLTGRHTIPFQPSSGWAQMYSTWMHMRSRCRALGSWRFCRNHRTRRGFSRLGWRNFEELEDASAVDGKQSTMRRGWAGGWPASINEKRWSKARQEGPPQMKESQRSSDGTVDISVQIPIYSQTMPQGPANQLAQDIQQLSLRTLRGAAPTPCCDCESLGWTFLGR